MSSFITNAVYSDCEESHPKKAVKKATSCVSASNKHLALFCSPQNPAKVEELFLM